jgi:SPP1 gp7 family putative phage head morphogenesis protein
MAPIAAETVYRVPGRPWLLWDLDPYDPAGSESVAVEYQAAIDKLFSRLKKRLLAIDLRKLDYYKNHVTLVHAADVFTITAHVDTIINDMQGEAQNAIAGVTLKSYQQGQNYGHYLLKPYAPGETGAPFTIGKHDQHLVDLLTQQGLTSIQGVTDDVRKEIGRVLGEGLLAGEGIDGLTKRLQDSINGFDWKRSELIARTETVAALNRGAMERFKNRGIKSYYWLSCRDDHTCWECQALDGTEFPVDAPTSRLPPLHPRCRCTMVPVIRGLNDDQVLKRLPPEMITVLPRITVPVAPILKTELDILRTARGSEVRAAIVKRMHEADEIGTKIGRLERTLTSVNRDISRLTTKQAAGGLITPDKIWLEKSLQKSGKLVDELLQLKATEAKLREEVFEAIFTNPKTMNVVNKFKFVGDTKKFNKKQLDEAHTFLTRFLDKSYQKDGVGRMQFKITYEEGRAFYRGGTKTIHVDNRPASIVHEFGHALEGRHRGVDTKAQRFLAARTKGEQPVSLKKLSGPRSGYADNEVTKKDKFIDPYCGKQYPDGSTEITSMGFQYMFEDPIGFAKKDPEYFEYIINIARRLKP